MQIDRSNRTSAGYIDNIHTLSPNIKFISTSLINREKTKRSFGALFSPVSQQVQINFKIADNVCILCLPCNVKNSKTTTKLC